MDLSSPIRIAGLATVLLVFGAVCASAQTPSLIGTFQDWSAFRLETDNQNICFVASEPKEQVLSNPNARRGNVYFLVTHWVERSIWGEPSVVIGYPQREGSKTLVEIGDSRFEMFTQEDGAWFADPETERQVISAMKRGVTMRVRGVSGRGTRTTDVYSLRGITAALDKIDEVCKN